MIVDVMMALIKMAFASAFLAGLILGWGPAIDAQSQAAPSATNSTTRPVGTVKAISGNTITVTTDSGTEILVRVQPSTRIVRPAPGPKDLKDAPSVPLAELQAGDRMIIRGSVADDGKSVVASSILVMTKADIQQRQEHEREDWQRRGVGGLVKAVDPGNATITLLSGAPAQQDARDPCFEADSAASLCTGVG